jgi:hypothetical protein
MKSLREISLPITEEEYRNDGAMHYSTLATFERGGFRSIPTLFDKKESPSLLFGSMVDTMVTDGMTAFGNTYFVADLPTSSDVIINIVKSLFALYKDEYYSLNDISDAKILAIADQTDWGKTWKSTTKVSKIREGGTEYYKLLYLAGDKTIVSSELYSQAYACMMALKTSPATKELFADDDPFSPEVEHLYQLKFKQEFEGIPYSCMADLIVVFHDRKIIIPCDLKTSSHTEEDFYKSFVDWSYMIQARLYWRIIKKTLEQDDYFKDFKLLDYHFIVVNRTTLTPLVWVYSDTQALGTLRYGINNQIECRDPFTIGKELDYYLKNPNVKMPINIHVDKPNNLKDWLKTL